jgi:sugar/nucleoside kinase (ribokinase family)
MKNAPPEFIFLGGLREDYCITQDGRTIEGVLGGNAIYAAIGAKLWAESVGLLTRVGANYPGDWLDDVSKAGVDTRGLKVLPEQLDTRTFYAYITQDQRTDVHPSLHYQRLGLPLPKALAGYESSTRGQDARDSFSPAAVRPEDIPQDYLHPHGVHLCPAEYLTHSALSHTFQVQSSAPVTLDPSERYMTPAFRDDLPRLLHGLTAFLPSEQEARSFFPSPGTDNWDLADAFADMGPEVVVLKLGAAGQNLFDRKRKMRWRIPAYPARVRDVTGAGDAYCGGFLVGLVRTGDALEAALYGAVSASLVVEGSGALYALETTPGLAQARLEALRSAVKQA